MYRGKTLEIVCTVLFGVAAFEGMLILLDHGYDTAALAVLVGALVAINVYVHIRMLHRHHK